MADPLLNHLSWGIGKQIFNLCFGSGRELVGCWTPPERGGSDGPKSFYPCKVVPMAGEWGQDGVFKFPSIPKYPMILSR